MSLGVDNRRDNAFSPLCRNPGSIPARLLAASSQKKDTIEGVGRMARERKSLTQLTDSYNRKMDYLRISVTDRCNFRCQYCMPENIEFKDKSHILTLEEMLTFAEACLQLGVTKVRVTGGEPLVRRGVVKFVAWLKDLGFEDVTMTTNGYLLEENLDGLVEAGVGRINISLDTLQPEKFAFITRRDHFQKVWDAVVAALEAPPSPGKEILERAQEQLGDLMPVEKEDPAAPADEFKFEGAPGTFGVITPVSEPFCARCSRLRLTADGKIHPCLLTDLDVPVKDAIRSPDPIPAIHQVLWHTPRVNPPAGLTLPEEARNRTMS